MSRKSHDYWTWQTSSDTFDSKAPANFSKLDRKSSKFSQIIKIEHDDAFKLKPATIDEGALKGRKVLVLEPITDHFRILDLPPEIRNLIYEELLKEEKPIVVDTLSSPSQVERPVSLVSTAFAILRSNKQILSECAPLAYGSNTFGFYGYPPLRLFLESIGSMRKHLRHIKIFGSRYHTSLATTTLNKLKDAKDLQSLSFGINMGFGNGYTRITTQVLFRDCRALLKVLHKAHKAQGTPHEVLNVIRLRCLNSKPCAEAEAGKSCDCDQCYQNVNATTAKKQNEELRGLFAQEFGIEDGPFSDGHIGN